MKRFLTTLLVSFLLFSCDDGDLTPVNYDFSETPALACGENASSFYLYKTTENRAVLLKISPDYFKNTVNEDNPRHVSINGSSVSLIFRTYSGTVTSSDICSSIPPATPTVVSEDIAIGGDINIITTAIRSTNEEAGTSRIDAYLHTIYFQNVSFESQRNQSLQSITYRTAATTLSNFSNINEISKCDNGTIFYKNNGSQSITLNLEPATVAYLFNDQVGIEKELEINETNSIEQRIYNVTSFPLTDAYFCTVPMPNNPPILENWRAVSGTISVTSVANANGFTHSVILKNVILSKDGLEVRLGYSFDLGKYYSTL